MQPYTQLVYLQPRPQGYLNQSPRPQGYLIQSSTGHVGPFQDPYLSGESTRSSVGEPNEQHLAPKVVEEGPANQLMAKESPSTPEAAGHEAVSSTFRAYLAKFAGKGVAGPPQPPVAETGFSVLGSFCALALIGMLHSFVLPALAASGGPHLVMLVGSFGAMAILIFSLSKAPLAQPKNAILGNTIGGFVGVTVANLLDLTGIGCGGWLSAALAVSLTIVVQERCSAVHPPGGATALLYVILPPLRNLGYTYAICPALLGTAVMVAVGLLTNNLSQARAYPQGWGCASSADSTVIALRTLEMTEEAAGSDAITEEEPSPLQQYLRKFAGAGVKGPAPPPLSQSAFSFLGSFAGLATLGLLQEYLLPALAPVHLALVIGSFGAMAVLIYSQPQAPASQPKNCLLGNPLGGVVGIIVVKAMEVTGLQEWLWLSAALAVSLTIFAQELTATVSPPGGATALIFVLRAYGAPSGPLPHDVVLYEMGHWYVLCPAFLGSVVLVAVGLVTNNLSAARSYPQGWW